MKLTISAILSERLLTRKASIRRTTATILTLVLVSQGILWLGAGSIVAQSRDLQKKNSKATKRKKKSGTTAASRIAMPWIIQSRQAAVKSGAAAIGAVQNQVAIEPQDQAGESVQSVRIEPSAVTVVNFRQLSKIRQPHVSAVIERPAPAPMTIDDSPNAGKTLDTPAPSKAEQIPGPSIPSPAPSQNFLAQEDAPKVGTGTFTIPPDTMGAVGLDKVFVTVNNNYRVQNKATGAALSTVSIDTFWASTGASGAFDPRVQYDPYNNRWILAAVSNAQTANSSVLVGISQTSDPEGLYTLFRVIVGCAAGAPGCNANGEWADFPMVGFNKNWVAIGWNPFTINTNAFIAGKVLVLDYPTLRTGTAVGSLFSGISAANAGFCIHPATTFSTTEETLYAAAHLGSAGATYRLHTITGTPAAPSFTIGALQTRPGGGWTQPGGDILPQQCVPGVGAPTQTCPATLRQIDATDAFIRSNVIFRNGKIYYPQTIVLPAGGITSNSRIAAQWTALNPDGTFFDGGRVEDPTATRINGGNHYAFPSLAVNKNNDILFGFSEYELDDYVDAGYTFRLGTDAAGTMRDPVIYKEGEDYYSKTFSGTRNRWGDFSHSVVDPVNDRDLWTIQEYAQLRVGTTGQGSNDSRWGTWWAKVTAPAGIGDLIISEFRLHGPNGPNDEFVEIFNASGTDVTVQTADGSAGFSLVADDGIARFTIPNGTVIPAGGHYLGVNSVGYSLASYPAGNGTTATGDATYTTNITSGEALVPGPGIEPLQGIALFNTANPANFTLTNRLDAVGFASTSNSLYKEGTGISNTTYVETDQSFYRSLCPGNTPVFGTALGCGAGGLGRPRDTNANQNDFVFVDTNGTSAGAGQRLGAPGPENLSSPIERNSRFGVVLLDASVGGSAPPNRVRDFTSDPGNNSTFGTLEIRRRVVNNTGAPVTRLRFRIADINTFPAPSGFADLRARTSTLIVVSGVNDASTCFPAPAPCATNVEGTTLEQPPSQPNGGGFNSSTSVTLAAPLAPGASVNVRFLLGIQQTGSFRFFVNVEALP